MALYLLQHEEDSTACYREGCRGTVPLANLPDAGLHFSAHTQSPDRCSGRRKSPGGIESGRSHSFWTAHTTGSAEVTLDASHAVLRHVTWRLPQQPYHRTARRVTSRLARHTTESPHCRRRWQRYHCAESGRHHPLWRYDPAGSGKNFHDALHSLLRLSVWGVHRLS